MGDVRVVHGDCLTVLRSLPNASVDAVVTDPPYGLADHRPAELVTALTGWVNGDREQVPDGKGFMGKAWDAFVPPPAVWDECLRVLKPGGHLVAFAGSRTYDLMGLSIRLAGFEIRDGLQWLYGSGFPKGQDVGKAIDRAAGAVREVVGVADRKASLGSQGVLGNSVEGVAPLITAPATAEAARWAGWNTSLKPAHEPIVLARKPLSGTVAATVLEHGTGALNVDATRVSYASAADQAHAEVPQPIYGMAAGVTGFGSGEGCNGERFDASKGRWPANVLLSHDPECNGECVPGCPVAELDAQSGGGGGDGGASRFFPTFRYQAKAPKAERPRVDGVAHPTVKPLLLMAWLVRLICPPGGVVLDPFAGSGTTLQAARDEGMASIGIERDPSYLPLIAARLGLGVDAIEQMDDDEGAGDGRVAERDPGGEPGLPLHGHGGPVGNEAPDPMGSDPAGREAVHGPGAPERMASGGEVVSPLDFGALGTGAEIRQALDVLARPGTQEVVDAVGVVLERVQELETRLNTARRSAWVAVPVEAETIAPGDTIVAKDGVLMSVRLVEISASGEHVNVAVYGRDAPFLMKAGRPVPVLRRPTADALNILTRQLGAQATT